MIKYLIERFPSSTVLSYYMGIADDSHPVEAVIDSSNGTTDWLGDYFREYVGGNIYGVQAAYWKGEIPSQQIFSISTAADTVKKFNHSYQQMGARLYQVGLSYQHIPEGTDISFTLTGTHDEKTEVSVFKCTPSGQMELIDYSTTGVIVEDVKDLVDSWHDLFALVTNRHLEPPYTDDTDIRLVVRLQGGLDPTGCAVVVRDIDCVYRTTYPDTTYSDMSSTHDAGFPKEQGATVEFTGTTLTQMHDHVGNDGYHYVGSMTVTFDAAFQNVTSFSAYSTISKDDWTLRSSVSGHDIPLYEDGPNRIFKMVGTTTCGRLTAMAWCDSHRTYFQKLLPGWTCSDESRVEVWLLSN
jgi:hypothetical protein